MALGIALALNGCAASPLPRFEATLAANDSATVALQNWCAAFRLTDSARVVAAPVAGPPPAEPADLRARLGAGPDELLGYRHVRLSCGGRVLSEAHNWFLPALLTPDMNHALATTDTPFGKVIAPLGFRRERLATVRGRAEGCPQDTILSNRALLRLPDGRALSLVVECYTSANLR